MTKIVTRYLGVAALILALALLGGCGANVTGAEEYVTVTVPSDMISASYTRTSRRNSFGFPYWHYTYIVSHRLYLELEATQYQYGQIRNFLQEEGGGGFWLEPQFVDGQVELVRRERSYVMVELRYIPDPSNRRRNISHFSSITENGGRLLNFTVLYVDNTVGVSGDAIELISVPVTFRQRGVHPYTYWITDGDELNIEVSQAQHEELREILEGGNVTLELQYRPHTGRLLEFSVLEG